MLELLQPFEHLVILILAGLVCIPMMWLFARVILEDFEILDYRGSSIKILDSRIPSF